MLGEHKRRSLLGIPSMEGLGVALPKRQKFFEFEQAIRWIAKVNDSVAVCAKDSKILQPCCSGLLCFSQWNEVMHLAVFLCKFSVRLPKGKVAGFTVE